MESKEILEIAVKAAENKRAEDLTALDMTKVSLMADYFLIMELTLAVKFKRLPMKLRIRWPLTALRCAMLKVRMRPTGF